MPYIRSVRRVKAKAARNQARHKARQDGPAMSRVAAEIEIAATGFMTSDLFPIFAAAAMRLNRAER